MDLEKLIIDNMAILDADLDNREALAEQKLSRQHEALLDLYNEIKPIINEAGYHIALFQTHKHHTYKPRCSEEQWNRESEEMAKMIQIEFVGSISLENTGESENYYLPHVRKHDRQHCGGDDPSYIKISWDETRGVYFMVPNVAYKWNEEREDVDKRTYLELHGTKDMIIERLAVVLASIMRIQRNFNMGLEKDTENEHR